MNETSRNGLELLRALALAVRSEQDFDLVPASWAIVGALKREGADPTDARTVKSARGSAGMVGRAGYEPLTLRESLNKIAHSDPQRADYYVGPLDEAHDLLLYGEHRGRSWFAALSLLEFIRAVRSLPDAKLIAGTTESS